MAIPAELRHDFLQGLVERNADVELPLKNAFFPDTGLNGPGTIIKYEVLTYRDGMARMVARDARAPRSRMPTRAQVMYEAPTFKESIILPPSVLKDIRAPGTLSQSQKDAAVARATRQTRKLMETRREWLAAQWLTGGALLSATAMVGDAADGNIYVDSDAASPGFPLGPIDMGLLPTHIAATTPVSATSWADPTANVKGDLDAAAMVLERDGNVSQSDIVVLMNNVGMQYITANDDIQAQIVADPDLPSQYTRTGAINRVWGYEIQEYNHQWPVVDTMNPTNTLAMVNYIPDNVVIVTTRSNVDAGREMVGVEPSDLNAPSGARGYFAWTDEEQEHPHELKPGIEYNGGPVETNPDTHYILADVTNP